jgi:hypothetical protein
MLWMIIGFSLACYAVIGNDSIQTLGTFLASNRRRPWWLLWAYLGSILAAVLIYGWYVNSGDVSYGRLSRIPEQTILWWHALPILALLFLTRWGIPVSTTFMALSIFTGSIVLEKIIMKSLVGYGVAFGTTLLIWAIVHQFEKHVLSKKGNESVHPFWVFAQWASTGFLWTQWLMQDLANIYVFVPRVVPVWLLFSSLALLLGFLAFLIRENGGKIQEIVLVKTNTLDIRSATLIDFFYGLILFYFKSVNNLPMSTTWVFLGTLAGRELILTLLLRHKSSNSITYRDIVMDLGKASIGLVISVLLAFGGTYLFTHF